MSQYAGASRCGGSSVYREQSGGIITGWLIQLVVIMALLAFIGHDVVAVAITSLNLDNTARDVAEAAGQAYSRSQDHDETVAAAEPVARSQDAELVSLEADGPFVEVVVTKSAGTWWAHRIGPLRDLTNPTATGRRRWQ